MKIKESFDSWVQSGPFTTLDVSVFRIIFAISMLAVAPDLEWLAGYPEWMYRAPLGPFQLISSFPPVGVLLALELLRTLALVLLAVGLWTRFVSFLTSGVLLLTFGLTYSLGKVDHTVLLVLIPAVLAFADWGGRLSIDSALSDRSDSLIKEFSPQWPMRFLALLIGLSFFEAAAVKLGTGWLDLSTQAVRGHFREAYISIQPDTWLTSWAFNFTNAPAWEVLDWMTVILEFAFILTVPWWTAFRFTLACATLFHLGVLLIMNIPFSQNIIAYGAFVSWGYIAIKTIELANVRENRGGWFTGSRWSHRRTMCTALAGVLAVTACAWWLTSYLSGIRDFARDALIFAGAVGGLIYIAYLARGVAAKIWRSKAPKRTPVQAGR